MIIGIDISTVLNHGQDIGSGRYIINLIRNLLKIDRENTYALTGRYTTGEYIPLIQDLKTNYPENKIKLYFYQTTPEKLKLWNRLRFPAVEVLGFRADIIHCPDFLIPPTLSRNIVLTIHDLAFIRFPEFNFDWFIKKYTGEVKKNAYISKKIIGDSESTRNDIVNFLEIDPAKIEVVYLAADDIFRKLTEKEKNIYVLKKYQIDKKDILFIGRIPDQDLVQIYNWAELFVYPSFFEGFGLPPLEAMSCGLPVIAFNTSSLKEVVGDAGILVAVGDESALKDQIA